LSSWAWDAVSKAGNIPPFALPLAAAESFSHTKEDTQLQQNADANLLLLAVREGNSEKASLLLENGANPNLEYINFKTLLTEAIRF